MQHLSNSIRTRSQTGMTVVELLIVVTVLAILMPIVVFTLGDLYSDNIGSISKTKQDTDTRSVLRAIEDELKTASSWATSLAVSVPLGPTNNTTTPETWSFCGRNGVSDCSSSVNRVLIASTITTDKVYTDTTRLPIFANVGGICDTTNLSAIIKTAQIYFVAPDTTNPSKSNLYRRTVLNPQGATLCSGTTPYQATTCASAVISQTGCQDSSGATHTDAILLTDVTSFNVDYYSSPGDSTAIGNEYTASAATIAAAPTIKITVTTQTRINGTLTPNTADIRITRPN